MDMQEGLDILYHLCSKNDWFHDVCIEARRYVVYVHRMGPGIEEAIPDMVAGRQVVVHFAPSKNFKGGQLVKVPDVLDVTDDVEEVPYDPMDDMEELPSDLLHEDLSDLCKELDRLEKVCGSNILQDIFYEIHDGKNAVTNLRAKFPDVHQAMMKVYNEYGFSVVYEELDG
jgi:hypothetical protein